MGKSYAFYDKIGTRYTDFVRRFGFSEGLVRDVGFM